MVDCTVSGGAARLAQPRGHRSFTCSGSLGEAFTARTVSGGLTGRTIPRDVTVSGPAPTAILDRRPGQAAQAGPSALHAGYLAWDITGRGSAGDLYTVHVPPVLPARGGFFDADLEIAFAGGANGSWQIPMFDCRVR
jgi:hypothetical protein